MLGELRVISEPKVKFSRNKISFKQADFFKLTDLDVESESLFDPFNLHNTVNGTPITIVEGFTKPDNYYRITGVISLKINFQSEILTSSDASSSGCIELITNSNGSPRLICILRRYVFKR